MEGGVLKSGAWRPGFENVAAIARLVELALWVSLPVAERRCPIVWSHLTEGETD